MKVLIIGGTGFIGKNITKVFCEQGHDITLFHRNKNTTPLSLNVRELIGTREKIEDFKNRFNKLNPDFVIDTIPYTAQDIWLLQKTFKGITNNLLLLSSGDVYKAYEVFHDNLPEVNNDPLTEGSELRSRLFPYRDEKTEFYNDLLFNYDKIVIEMMLQKASFNTTILRLPAVFGPGGQKLKEYIVPMLNGHESITMNRTKAEWIWTRSYVVNVAHAVYLAAINKNAKNEIFNLGDIHMNELAFVTMLKELSGWKGEIILTDVAEDSYNYAQNIQLESSKIKHLLNYLPIVDVEKALLETINGYS